MGERDSILPVLLGLIVAIVVHVAFFTAQPLVQGYYAWDATVRKSKLSKLDAQRDATAPPLPQRDELELGRDKSVVTSSVAWIPYDDVRELLAEENVTEQPATQMQVDPVEHAPLLIDAEDPTPQSDPQPFSPTAALSQLLAEVTPPSLLAGLQAPPLPVPLPESSDADAPVLAEPAPQVQEGETPSPINAEPMPDAQEDATEAQDTPPAQPAPPSINPPQPRETQPRPTAAARSDRESPPTAIEVRMQGSRTGRVEVMEGLEVLTVAPRLSVASYLTSAPSDAVWAITFDEEGAVSGAHMHASSRYADIDAAIEAAVYKWRAQGEKLEDAPHTITVTFRS